MERTKVIAKTKRCRIERRTRNHGRRVYTWYTVILPEGWTKFYTMEEAFRFAKEELR